MEIAVGREYLHIGADENCTVVGYDREHPGRWFVLFGDDTDTINDTIEV